MSKQNKAKNIPTKWTTFSLKEIRIHLLLTKFEKMFASQIKKL